MADNASSTDSQDQAPTFHPGFGCGISLIALGIFAGSVIFAIYVFMKQSGAISEFAQDEIAPTAVAEVSEADSATLHQRLEAYTQAARKMESAEIALTTEDLNAMIATVDELAVYRGLIYFTEIPPGGPIKGNVCFPIRKKLRFWENRYIVGQVEIEVQRINDNLYLVVSDISVEGEELPQGFRDTIASMQWLTPFRNDELNGPVLKNSRDITIEEGRIALKVAPPALPSEEDENE